MRRATYLNRFLLWAAVIGALTSGETLTAQLVSSKDVEIRSGSDMAQSLSLEAVYGLDFVSCIRNIKVRMEEKALDTITRADGGESSLQHWMVQELKKQENACRGG